VDAVHALEIYGWLVVVVVVVVVVEVILIVEKHIDGADGGFATIILYACMHLQMTTYYIHIRAHTQTQ